MSYIISEQRVKQFNNTQNRTEYSASIICDDVASLPMNNSDYWYLLGSDAKVISNGKRYIINSSGVWVEQPSENAWENVYTKAEVDTMVNAIYQTMLYYHTAQESSDGSITFYTLGTPVSSLTIYGNGQQTGTPTPDNPVMPTFCGVRTGNLFDSAVYELVPVSASAQRKGTNLGVLPQGTYTFNAVSAASTTPIYRTIKNGSTYTFEAINSLPYTFTADGVSEQIIRTTGTQGNTWADSGYSSIMLNSGSTALPYEPYGWAEKITCAGQTVPVYLGQTQTVRRVKKLVLTGEEDWEHYGSGAFWAAIATGNAIINRIGLCNAYKLVPADGSIPAVMNNGEFTVLSTNGRLFIKNTSYANAALFKSYLAEQYAAGTPVTIWYVLATPETAIVNEPLCKIGDYADELHNEDAGVTIPTVSGENTLTVDTTLPPSKIVISGESN